jgi:mannose-6-phosphate isomerase-like protein (cupin superfamily)
MTDATAPTPAAAAAPAGKYLVDPYGDWAKGENIPIVSGRAIDLFAVECKPWPRFGVNGAFCHLDGRCDFLTLFLIELPPGACSAPQQHLYEELCFVLAGHGTTEIELWDGEIRVLEWGPRSLFSVPTNARHWHRNNGGEPARFAAINDLRYLLGLFRNERFIFGTPLVFAERGSDVVPDLALLALDSAADDGTTRSQALSLAAGTIGADVAELPVGTYGQAKRQMQGSHLFGVGGEGYTLTWEEGAPDYTRTDWRFGVVTAPPGMAFRQHFNAGPSPARFLDVQLGSQAFPMFRRRRAAYGDKAVYASGSAEIAYADQDPRIHSLWQDVIKVKGAQSQMRNE